VNFVIDKYLSGLELGKLQTYKNMGIIPLFPSGNGGPAYATLQEAIEQELVVVTEIGQAGRVPELKVTNISDQLILLLDGEELIGAKQNRVLNTSILLEPHSEMVIPVSCTEQGRWAYTSAAFSHSRHMMSHGVRSGKSHTVTESLRSGRGHSSDQRYVWAEIDRLHRQVGTSSPTHALRDAYVDRAPDLDAYLQAFECVPHQRGCLVLINGRVAGMDVISREEAYVVAHPQLVKSYALDALLQAREQMTEPNAADAETFLQEAMQSQASRFDAVGKGDDYRFQGTTVGGSALVYGGHVIHLALFRDRCTAEFRVRDTTIRVTFGDIAKVDADAIVSSDNGSLTMKYGVARAIREAAGESVLQDAAKHAPLRVGDVAVTSGGRLSASYVFHAVVADLEEGIAPSEESIRGVVLKSLERADALGLRRIAFPMLGTGAGRFPFESAVEVMTRAMVEYLDKETWVELVTIMLHVPRPLAESILDLFRRQLEGLD
jgi:O-acetyl-ADP-ribose deacetylase (regulator of RNase III)